MTIFIGVDPGGSGAIAILEPNPPEMKGLDRVLIQKMPETERDTWRRFDPREFGMPFVGNAFAMIEHLEPRPTYWKDKNTGEFKRSILRTTGVLMQHYGLLRGFLIAAGIPFEEVRPQVWQKAMGCMSKGNKANTKARCEQLYPHVKVTLKTADALLLAAYAQRIYSQRTTTK